MWATRILIVAFALYPLLAAPRKALLIDGQNNHDWRTLSPYLARYLAETGLFTVETATAPPKGGDMEAFRPSFKNYAVVVLNYNGEDWSTATRGDFEKYMRDGGALVVVHAANNAFPSWPAYNAMIGLGGWGGRAESAGPYLRFREGQWVPDATTPGRGGHHGKQHVYKVTLRDGNHPITRGLPPEWLHATDELYDSLRGPAKGVHVIASGFADRAMGGSGEHEPLLMTLRFGKGRIFHTALGTSVDFIVTLQRGAEWAATGKVTQKMPSDFPGPDKISQRP
jgi:uncharacterized protein